MTARPLLVVGVSGVGWEILDREIVRGRMPNLATLVAEGVSTTLLSERVTGDRHFRPQVAWATLATGCTAQRHGVTRFFHEGADLREKAVWDHWQEHGLRVGIYGWPGLWPPRPAHGFLVPSHLARDDRTWPPELAPVKTLERLQQNAERDPSLRRHVRSAACLLGILARHRVPPSSSSRVLGTGVAATIARGGQRRLLLRRAKLELSTEVFCALLRRHRPDLAAFVTFYADLALHRFWRDWNPDGPPSQTIPRALADVDRALGRILRAQPTGGVVAFVSEHGMEAEPESRELGAVFYAIRGERVLDLVDAGGAARSVAVARWIAYRPAVGGRLPADLAERLRRIVVVESGLPLFNVFEHGDDEVVVKLHLPAEEGVYRSNGLAGLTARFDGKVVGFRDLTRPIGARRSAMHAERAAFLVSGPGIRRDERIGDARLVDVLPTLAAAAGLPAPTGLDGRCLDVFA